MVQLAGAYAHGACLFGDDAFGALAWYGIDFKEEELVACGVIDVVETADTTAVEVGPQGRLRRETEQERGRE